MNVTVIWDSMYGNTRRVAEAIAAGLESVGADVSVVHASEARLSASTDLVVIGAPMHALGLPSARTRRTAATMAESEPALRVDPCAAANGVRELLDRGDFRAELPTRVAAFDTRVSRTDFLAHGANRIARRLRRAGSSTIGTMSFYVTSDHELCDGELRRAREWGQVLAHRYSTTPQWVRSR